MKKSVSVLLVLALMLCGAAAFAEESVPETEEMMTGRSFEGEWVATRDDGSTLVDIEAAGESYLASVSLFTEEYTREFRIDYVCRFDEETVSLISEQGAVMREITRNDDYEVIAEEPVYDDGAAVFSLDGTGRMAWSDLSDEDGTITVLERPIGWIDPDYIGPGNHFAGVWNDGRVTVVIEERMDDYVVTIDESGSVSSGVMWLYLCRYDEAADSLVSEGDEGWKVNYTIDDEGVYNEEYVYMDGSAVFSLSDEGYLTWDDAKENAGADRMFERMPDTWNDLGADMPVEGLHADIQPLTDSPEWVTSLPQAQDGNVTQLFIIAGLGMDRTTATVSMHQRDENGSWKQILSSPGFVGKNGLCMDADHREGCAQTPIGEYHFNKAFGIAADPGCALPYTQVDEYTYWSGDPDRQYNQMVDIRDIPDLVMDDSEHIVDYEYEYQYCLNISFNEDGTPGRGSAIFLHCFGRLKPYTGGCVALPENIMRLVMQNVRGDCVVVIDTLENMGGSF